MRPFLQFLSIVSLLSTLAACGTKGPLYLPPPTPTKPAAVTQTPPVDDSTAQEPAR